MTPEEVDALPAGPEMNAQVEQNVFGNKVWLSPRGWLIESRDSFGNPSLDDRWAIQDYSWDIAAAWEIVQKVSGLVSLEILFGLYLHENGQWEADWGMERCAYGETAPLAICRAALKAVNA